MNGAELLVAGLEAEGVTHVFGVPGEENLHMIEALRTSSITFVVTRHEQHAAFMAATQGRLTGRAGVCLSTLGPGATNLVTGIAYAQLGGMPLVAITGQKALHGNLQGRFQLMDVVSMFRPLTKWATSITDPQGVPRSVRHAFSLAEAERPGAVHLELPEDVAAAPAPGLGPQRRIARYAAIPPPDSIAAAAAMLGEAETPVVLASSGAMRRGSSEALRAFLEHTGLMAMTTQMGKGAIPEDHPQSLFGLGIHARDYVHAALDRADLVMTVGYDAVEYPPAVWNPERVKQILHVDFRPADPDEYYAPALELVGDVAPALQALAEALPAGSLVDEPLVGLRARIAERLFEAACRDCFPPTPQSIVYGVRTVMGRDDVVSLDNGIYKVWFARMYRTQAPNTLLLDNALATMGAGLAAAMSARMFAGRAKRVLAVCGDGGFLMNLQDLETAVRLGLDLVVLILRDDAYGFIRWKQEGMDLPDHAMDFGNPDFVTLAQSFGATGLRVDEAHGLEDRLEVAFRTGGVVVVDCPIDYGPNDELAEDRSDEIAALLEDD